MIVFLGVVVGGIVISMYLPLFTLIGQLSNTHYVSLFAAVAAGIGAAVGHGAPRRSGGIRGDAQGRASRRMFSDGPNSKRRAHGWGGFPAFASC